jgi:rod shape-determining protein MreC
MARISPTRGQKLIFILYILLGVGILYLDITSNSFQSVKNGFKSFKISSSYFLNQITIEQIKNLSKRSKSKKSLIKENEMLKEALDLSHLNNYLIAKENHFYKDHEIIKYAAHDKNYQSSYKIAQLRSFDPNIFNCCDRHRMFVEVISDNNEDFNEFMVFNSSGIIGQIIHTNKYSEVLLLTDISHYIPIKSNTNDFFCNAQGSGRSEIIICTYNPLVEAQEIIVGHQFYTSGLGGIYPKDIEIGQVEKVIKIDSTTVELEIKLSANPISSNLLGVIKY